MTGSIALNHHAAANMPPSDITADTTALVQLGQAVRRAGYRFTSVSPEVHARVNARAPEWAADLTDILGWNRPFRSDQVTLPADVLQLMHQACILRPCRDGWRSTLRLATLGRHCYFHGTEPDEAYFGPDTYRFMRAFEHDVGTLAQAPARIADIGCGAGAAAIALATRWPRASVTAFDTHPAALRLARANAQLAGTANVTVRQGELPAAGDGGYDLVVARVTARADAAVHATALVQAAMAGLNPRGTLMLSVELPPAAPARGGRAPFFDALTQLMAGTGWKWHYTELDPELSRDAHDNGLAARAAPGQPVPAPAPNTTIWLVAHAPARAPLRSPASVR